ncbi:MAG TPA: response regulator [Chitinophagaceae bacterium]|jgi:signal transduction histidine kinase|nr:response regulator [Chitinophagaceae bacterium]
MEKTANPVRRSEAKILVVDDRADNLISIEVILEKDNYTIVKANSGKAALKVLLNDHDFSLILMDVQMPELNGYETATIIYERDKLRNIPIIFITANNYDEDFMFKGYRMGGVDYIYKPINPELLRAKVAVFVELYSKNQQLMLQEKKLLAANEFLQKEIEERKASEERVKHLNEQLVVNNASLKQMNEELDQFAYMASHDLQEPLRKIQVFSDKILRNNNFDSDSEKYFGKIINSSKRMQHLINNLLDFSRHTASSNDFKKTPLNELVKNVVMELEVEIEKSNARINFEDLPVVSAVPGLMQQLFYNLFSNAIKFRKPSVDLVIDIKAEKMNPVDVSKFIKYGHGKKYYKITVEDNGIGFDDKYAEDIFRVFKRLHSYHEFEGTGVGLSICKKIVEKHNGFIKAESQIDKGSTFIIGLPEMQMAN